MRSPRRLEVREVEWPTDPAATVAAMADDGEVAWLDSAGSGRADAADVSESLLAFNPVLLIEQRSGQPAELRHPGREPIFVCHPHAWRLWRDLHAALPPSRGAGPSALAPGWIGYVGFETATQLEARLPSANPDDGWLPDFRMALFDRCIVLQRTTRSAFALVDHAIRRAVGVTPAAESTDGWIARWNRVAVGAARSDRWRLPQPTVRLPERVGFEQSVGRALDYIAAGDIYQVNLSQRIVLEGLDDPLAAYSAVRRHNPSPYAALLRWTDGAVASVSPELFLQAVGRDVLTRPIKGTRPRSADPVMDSILRRDLLSSEKDAAELAMIVDLHRNDLGRVCEYGSVRVRHARRLETHPRVVHTVAEIGGRLAAGRGPLDLLAASFPAGSVTGVPKIRALQIIRELEPVRRGVFTGAIGHLGLDGSMMMNVAIRTLQIREGRAALHVGGGIVADSDPDAEYRETLDKARGILEGLGVQSFGEAARETSRPTCGA